MPIPRVDPVADSLAGSLAKRMVGKFAVSSPGQWFLRHISPHVDPGLMRLTRGRVSSMGTFPRSVLLTCTGAKSGVRRTTPLIYFSDGDRVILVASNYGGARHPAWYHNVKADPIVTLLGGGFQGRFVSEEVTGPERERLWALAKQWNPGYEQYESSAGGREIPLLALSPSG
ncbi:nitroreductase family deazaflavin-dependent oxidoreductase [Mycobacterium sp. SMC-2]|uniref:nitroreductase family deazaflavin-dependent oxidoreductase n=1 Tax=Mycobacterium sp. SMC-2 TaxID=2857058 RepID=UPI0021B3D567|nr:nitroreductase family deazaflavin-dependent oxidoreductase [Mycobacterium sp. SMC-2]UXA08173.1 nitroreductase family deazaflavin-dependent oxidoreductase [Mycobacterium sp. SMC-2]